MKKILCLILALGLVLSTGAALVSCGGEKLPAIYTYAEELDPTRTVTSVEYTDANGIKLVGWYDLQVAGENSIFTYEYDRYRTVEEAVDEGVADRIKTVSGTVYCKDGKYSGDGVNWGSSPVATEIKLNLDPDLLSDAVISEDGNTLTAAITPENSEAVLGTSLSAVGNISITATANGTYLTGVVLTCTTIEGATVTVRTSYSRNVIELTFPES
ncbi:MAG: hypothetical protein IJW48_01095 [Clostridia bacterium]|nr:hypothetical protein [Clostridia bacterium]